MTVVAGDALFNDPRAQQAVADDKLRGQLLDQYKLYVEMADRVSSRRAAANSYFLSINSGILAFAGVLSREDAALWPLALAGATLSYFWRALIVSYRNLGAAKWQVVQAIEAGLPLAPYRAERQAMARFLYRPLSQIELAVPWVFMGLHLCVLTAMLGRGAWPAWLPVS